MGYKKVCVDVVAEFKKEGRVMPILIRWSDGRTFEIQQVTRAERAPARVNALLPVRFTCKILNRSKFLYFEPEKCRWFVELLE